jgi:CheY-like chemotaxis protein
VQDALLCLCTALLHMEHGALRLSISAQAQYDAAEPEVAIELELEWLEEPERERAANACHEHELECAAARNLIQSQGGTLELQHNQEQCVARALVSLPAAPVSTRPADARPRARTPVRTGGRQRGNYGGVLVLEQDPAIRSLLAAELKSRGRNVFACSDAASARTLLRATPERFELMIVDQRAQAEPGHRLAESAARLCPDLHVCVLATDDATAEPPADLRERLHRLGKPFGMPELRSLLEDLLPR